MTNHLPLPTLFLQSEQKGKGTRTITFNLNRGLYFPTIERIYATLSQAILPYSFINISQDLYRNACWAIIPDNGNPTIYLEIPEGLYPSLTELEQAFNVQIQEQTNATPPFDPSVPSTYHVILTANTSTNQVIFTITDRQGGLSEGDKITFDCPEGNGLGIELGFPAGTEFEKTDPATPYVSSEPVIFNDILASGVLVKCGGDLQVETFFNKFDSANILAQIPITNADFVGSTITYPRDLTIIDAPMVNNMSVKELTIRFVSPRDPERDLYFLQGDASVAISFKAIY